MDKHSIKVIVFDVDGTLTDEVSWIKLTENLGADKNIHQEIFEAFKSGMLSYTDAKAQLIALWQSTGKAYKATLLNMFDYWELKPDAKEVITYLKSKYTIILISGSVDFYVETVAKKLNIEKWYANTALICDDKGKIVDFQYEVDQAQKKVSQLEEYLAETGYNKNNCLVIGNGDSDLGLFKELPYGIAINQDSYPELEKLAWKKIKTLSEIMDIL